ncbi:MAG: UDP-glucose/GDP-mannose dehydrogenase family protein [Nitrospirae bacterium]|nr:UDP-glucose/GDP-mannose dehydrogenase family protein [Nitrospirota bacterium]
MNICVIGTGYVGLVTGACFAEFGVKVICVDQDASKVDRLRKGEVPIYEPGLTELVQKGLREGRLSFTTDIAQGVEQSLVLFIAVGTPPRGDGSADLSAVEAVAETIARHMNDYKVVVTKSTVPVGTGERLRAIIGRSQTEHRNFDVASNPEFLREGAAIEDFMRPNRVVIGAQSDQAIAILRDLYRPLYLIETPIVITDIATAEMIKYASNAFLATKVSFINEIANLCERVGADVHQVARAMGLDGRIGSKFLHPGPGYGGSCFPKDVVALLSIGKRNGYEFQILKAVDEVNHRQRELMVDKIKATVGELKGTTLACLGLAFKPNTDDIREAPALFILPALQALGVTIRAYDPAAMGEAKKVMAGLVTCADPYDAMQGADGVILMTEWNQFRNLDLDRVKTLLRRPIFIDLRNVYEPKRMREQGFTYVAVGRN